MKYQEATLVLLRWRCEKDMSSLPGNLMSFIAVLQGWFDTKRAHEEEKWSAHRGTPYL